MLAQGVRFSNRPTSSPDHSTLVSAISPDPSRMSAVTRLSPEGGQPRIRLVISLVMATPLLELQPLPNLFVALYPLAEV